MKFSHSLQLNSVPEWRDYYLNYKLLKKVLYQLQEIAATRDEVLQGSSTAAAGHSTDNAKSQLSETVEKKGLSKWTQKLHPKKSKEEAVHQDTIELSTISDGASTLPFDDKEVEYMVEEVDFQKVTPKKVFESKLNVELKKVDAFYSTKEKEVFAQVENLLKDLKYFNETHADLARIKSADTHKRLDQDLERQGYPIDEEDDDEDDDLLSTAAFSTLMGDGEFNLTFQHEVTYKKRILEAFIDLSQLKSYIELNKMGFSKACKKFDKVLEENIRQEYVSGIEIKAYMFHPSTVDKVDEYLDELIQVYSGVTGFSPEESKEYLRSHLREHIVFERTTVWKQLIGIEKDMNNATGAKVLTGDESEIKNLYSLEMFEYKLPFTINLKFTKIEYFKFPKFFFVNHNAWKIYLAILVGGILLGVKTLNDRTQGNCLAVVAVCAILWATEAIPLFATSLLVPFLVVLCNTLKDEDTGKVMAAPDAATYILSTMWNSTIMLLLGGFTLAAGLSKYNIAKVASSWILHYAGTKPRNVLLAITGVALFLSMWISNVAAPVLAYSLIDPMLKSIPTNSGFAKALVLGIALVSDAAGMSTPISSPQNMIAIEALSPQPSWANQANQRNFHFEAMVCHSRHYRHHCLMVY
ncbi:unnamed protein product [Ambrosiozyma monospora]|uniref:Unnamed protein product n=1 Tax=Ambrosiozyma monospora TaxID=43982 RepID=A0ACB5T4J1_AMBMO|nr:unnamed protein product [Ambrosiozyma monospora]